MRYAFVDLHAVLCQLIDFPWIIGHQPNGLDLERMKHVRGNGIIAFVITEAKCEICFNCIQPLILQTVGADLVGQPNTASLLAKIKHNTLVHFTDFL